MQPVLSRRLGGRRRRRLSHRTQNDHRAGGTTTASDVLFRLQVTDFDITLLRSAPNGPDHFNVGVFVLHIALGRRSAV